MTEVPRRERLVFWAFMIFLGSQGLFLLHSVDLGLHLVVGEYTFHHGLPETNVFSPINSDYPIVQHEWAFQVISYMISAVGGLDGLVWVRLLIVLTTGLLLQQTLRPGRGYVAGVAFLALGLFVAHPRFIWRPELFSMLLLAAEYKLLIDFVEDRGDRLRFLPLIFIIWANVHGYFLVGLIVLGCFAAGELIEAMTRKKDKARAIRLIRIGVLCGLATLLNPYHYEGALYPFRLLIDLFTVDSHFITSIAELKPPHFFDRMWAVKAWYPLLIIFGITCAMQGRRIRFAYLLTALAIWLMARSTFRNIGLYGMTLGMLAAVQWQTAPPWKFIPLPSARFMRWGAVALSVVLLGMAVFIGTNRLYHAEHTRREFGVGVGANLDQPVRAFIRDFIPADAQVFNSFGEGSRYLWWFYPERRPFIDGNGDGYPPEFFAAHSAVIRGKQPLFPLVRRYGIDWVYLALDSPLAIRLYRHSKWHPVYLDYHGVIYVNEAPRFTALRKKFDLQTDLALGHIPDWKPTPLPSLLRHTDPRRERILGKFLYRVGERRAERIVRKHANRF